MGAADPVVRRAVFLDRDGVINRPTLVGGVPHPPPTLEALEILPGVRDALARLRRAGFRLIVVTNQPDVARGRQSREVVEAIHARLLEALPLDEIRVCYHDDIDACPCRKPKPALLTQGPPVDLAASVMVGDRWRDVEAGRRAGCATVLIDYGQTEPLVHEPDARVSTLAEAADWILARAAGAAEPMTIRDLKVKIFADGADLPGMIELAREPWVKGFTTNPTLMAKAGVRDYHAFASEVLAAIRDRPISFEVFSDEFAEMERQARTISTWGDHVWVKIPVTNTRGESSAALVRRLSHDGIKVNVTAVLALAQVRQVVEAVRGGAPSLVSVFAGRIADTGRDPVPHMTQALEILAVEPRAELVWASPRELLNIFQADAIGCHIITVTSDILRKLPLVGRDLHEFSLDTVKMFYADGQRVRFPL